MTVLECLHHPDVVARRKWFRHPDMIERWRYGFYGEHVALFTPYILAEGDEEIAFAEILRKDWYLVDLRDD